MQAEFDLTQPPGIDAGRDALFLDFDGTLTAIMTRPQQVVVGVSMRRALMRARAALEGRLAIISGRSISMLSALLSIDRLGIAGVHGLERRNAAGTWVRAPSSAGMAAARRELQALAMRHPRLLLEDKGLSLALHYRGAPDLEGVALDETAAAAARHGLCVQAGKMVFEVREPGPDKGDALAAFMAEAPFVGARPVFVGDDVTDEAGFVAATAMGGFGVLVGRPRPTAALYRLENVDAVEAWLASAAEVVS